MKHFLTLALVAVAVGLIAPGPWHTALALVALGTAYWIAVEWRS